MPPSLLIETIHAQSDPAPQKRKHPNTKRTGELAEAAFVVKAAGLGYAVSKPWGDSERYDFILDSGPRTWRVQIKCTESLNANGYQVQSTYTDQKKKGHYTSADIDVLVAYILPLDLWYVVPAHAFPASASLRFYPQGNISGRPPRFEQYREAWLLFQQTNADHPHSADHPDDTNHSGLKNCHRDPELAEGEGSAVSSDEEPAAPSPGPSAPEVPESPMERMMTQWAQRVHSLYNRKH